MKTSNEAILSAHSNLVVSNKSKEKLVLRESISEYDTIYAKNKDNEKLEEILDSISTEDKVKKPFLEYMEEKMFDGPLEGQQIVLTGSPSAGKTTELNRIARHLKENIADRENSIIHLFSLQNASESQSPLNSAEDLWQWIIKSHESRTWSQLRYTLDEFIEVNNRLNLQPILLIDTVDLLIYGTKEDDRAKITEYWQTIISTITKDTNWTVLWSCRTFEYNQITEGEELGLAEIKLPGLAYDEVAKRFKHNEGGTTNSDNAFLTALGCVFPIVAGYKKNLSEWSPIIREKYQAMHDYARNITLSVDDLRNKAGPIPWIIESLRIRDKHEIIGIDPLYEGLIEKICTEIAQETKKEISYLKKLWQEEIESEFWEAAFTPHTNNSRIHITHSSISLEDDDDEKLLHYLIDAAKNNGLLRSNTRSETYEMAHQLFTEYCIWKVSVRENRENESWIDYFPSCKIRGLGKVIDRGSDNEALIKEARKWFLPFYVFNENLALKFNDEDLENYTQTWRDCIHEAAQVLNVVSMDVSAANNVIHERYLNDEKRELLKNIDYTTPLLVNGPPGVGKSHLSYVWIDKKASGATWTELQPGVKRKINDHVWKQKPKAHFMTLSRGLVKQIDSKIDDYYDTSARPAEFTSWSIPKYIEKMRNMLSFETTDELTLDIFSQELEEEKKSGVGGWKKISAEELWGEFQNNFIDRFGKRKNTVHYQEFTYRSEFFNFAKDDKKQAKLFAQWAKNVGGNKKSLSEQAGECIEKVMRIIFDGSLEDREMIRSMQSDILVLDEIQDLPSPVIFLLLLMHNGPSGSVMMCGDDEQTLELSEFKWDDTFSKIQYAFWKYNELYEDYPLYEANGDILKKWTKDNLLNEMVKKNTHHLVVVERSVPPIVECVSESWNNGVSSKIPGIKRKHGENRGTGCIVAGEISDYRQENNKAVGTIDGVEIHNNWSWDQLIELARETYDDGKDVAFLLPDDKLWKRFSDMLASNKIFMEIWTPRLIKGLEYPEVIAICPWDISRNSIDKIIIGASKWKNWDEIETYAATNEKTKDGSPNRKVECITKLAKQKKRHVNVMLSRSQNLLKIVNIPDKDEYFKSQVPKALPDLNGITEFADPVPQKKAPSRIIPRIKLAPGHLKGIDEQEEEKRRSALIDFRKTAHALINRLRRIILSADTAADRLQIQLKANHLAHYLEKTNSILGTDHIQFPFELLGVVLKNISDNKDLKFAGLFDSGWDRYKEITKECYSPYLVVFEKRVVEFARKCRTTDDPDKLKVPVLELQNFNKHINRQIKNFTSINPICFEETKEGLQLREEVQNEILQSVFGNERLIGLDVNQWIETAKTIDLEEYLTEIDCTAANNEIFSLVRDLIVIEENEIENRYKEKHGEGTWKKLSLAKRKEKITDKRAKSKDINMKLVSEYWERGNQYLLKQKIMEGDVFDITKNIGPQLSKIEFQSYNFSEELVNLFWTCFKKYCTKEKMSNDEIKKMIRYCYYLHNLIQEKDKNKYSLNSVLSDDAKTSFVTRLLDAKVNLKGKYLSLVIANNSLGLFDLLKDNYPIDVHSNPKYQDYKDALKLGNELAENPKLAIGTTNQHEVFTFLSDKIMDIFEDERIRTDTFVSSCEEEKLIDWDGEDLVMEKIFDGSFGKFILSRSTDKSRENILVLLFALIHRDYLNKGIVSPGGREVKIRECAKKIFDSSESKDHKWKILLEDEHICKKIITIPYPHSIRSESMIGYWDEALDGSDHFIWGRKKGEFAEAIAWNKSIIKTLNEQNIENKLQLANDVLIKNTSSLFDLEDKKAIKRILKKEITSNINTKSWRDMVLLKDRTILNKNMPFGTLIPGIETLDAIYLYDKNDILVHEIKDEIQTAISSFKSEIKELNFAKHFVVKRLMKKIKKETGISLIEEMDRQLEYLSNFSISDLLIDFAAFFNRINDEGKPVIEKSLKWESLLETFAKDSDRHSIIVSSINQPFQRLDGTNMPGTSTKFQEILITFLQNYGSNLKAGFINPDNKPLNKYSVTKNRSTYEKHIAANHDNHLKKLP